MLFLSLVRGMFIRWKPGVTIRESPSVASRLGLGLHSGSSEVWGHRFNAEIHEGDRSVEEGFFL